MLSDGALSEMPMSYADLDLLGSLSASVVTSAGLLTAIKLASSPVISLVGAGQMAYSRPIGGSATMSLTLDGTPLLYVPLAGNAPMLLSADGQMVYSRPIGGAIALSLISAGQMTYYRPIGGAVAMSFVAGGSILTEIRLGTGVGAFINIDMSLFSGFVESTGIELDPIPRVGSAYPELWLREPSQYVGIIDVNDQLIEAEFSGRTYYLGISWNEEGQLWTMSIRNLDRQLLVSGVAIVPLFPLLRQLRRDDFPPGELIVAISGEYRQMLHRDSFKNGEAVLFYVEPEDLADAAL